MNILQSFIIIQYKIIRFYVHSMVNFPTMAGITLGASPMSAVYVWIAFRHMPPQSPQICFICGIK